MSFMRAQHPRVRILFFFSSRRRHTRLVSDWSSDVCSSDLPEQELQTTSFWCALHERAVAGWPKERVEVALAGLGNLLHGMAPLFLMCDPHDLGLAVEVRSPHTERPTIYLFDMTPGGIGFSERLFKSAPSLFDRSREHLAACGCGTGCPSCVGPAYALGPDFPESVAHLLSLA